MFNALYNKPTPKPAKITAARVEFSPPASCDCFESSAALSTSAQAVPSGYLSVSCFATISARRSGIIIRIPSNPPSTPTSITRAISRSKPRINIAGIVTPSPNAIDSPAEPAVCTMLFSRMVESRPPAFDSSRNSVIAITATGIEALTVRPTFSTKYKDDAPNTMPSRMPRMTARSENSATWASAGM